MAHNVPAVNEGFLCPIRKMRSILRAQKTLAERKLHKGRSPTAIFRSLAAYRRRTFTVLLYAVCPYFIILLLHIHYLLLLLPYYQVILYLNILLD